LSGNEIISCEIKEKNERKTMYRSGICHVEL
jgi:hypothetical protein